MLVHGSPVTVRRTDKTDNNTEGAYMFSEFLDILNKQMSTEHYRE